MSSVHGAPVRLALLALALPCVALAQRTDDNVTEQSDDAFGRSVGNESIGIYNTDEVRGFSPIDAGNARIEGLYFDRQTSPSDRLIAGSVIRVGIAAQGYAFPSPTGIVDYDLRRAGDKRIISPVISYGPYGAMGVEVDSQLPLAGEKLGLALGAGVYRDAFAWGGSNHSFAFAVSPSWKPTADLELRPFASRIAYRDEEPQPLMFTAGGVLPPRIRRERYFGQPWEQNEGETYTYGFIGNARLGAWETRLGLFESAYRPSAEFSDQFTGIEASEHTREEIVAYPDSRFASTSGELRAARTYEAGDRRHTLLFTARGRRQQRRYGGEQVVDAGEMRLGVGHAIPRPDLVFGDQSLDEVRQETAGAGYELRWKDRGDLSLAAQKTHYTKTIDTPEGALPTSRARPLLKSATATVYPSGALAVYASYTQGLEESPIAPSNAVNRNEAAPALITRQYDAGVRIALVAHLKLIAGVFNVEKPHFDLDGAGVFRALGTVRHRGVELSLAGNPIERLTVIAGTRFLDATVSGPVVDAGLIGRRPVGSARNYSIASLDYALPRSGLSFDTTVESISRQEATTLNTTEVPSRVVLHVGGRYRFRIDGKPATLRAQVSNVFDRYGWSVISGGAYVYNQPRRFSIYLATDL